MEARQSFVESKSKLQSLATTDLWVPLVAVATEVTSLWQDIFIYLTKRASYLFQLKENLRDRLHTFLPLFALLLKCRKDH